MKKVRASIAQILPRCVRPISFISSKVRLDHPIPFLGYNMPICFKNAKIRHRILTSVWPREGKSI